MVNLGSADTTEANLALTATIPANQSQVQIPVHAVDDSLLDGTQSVVLSAIAVGYDGGNVNVSVTDVESLGLTSQVTSIRENAGAQGLKVTLSRSNSDIQLPLTVVITSSQPDEIASPGTVTIPANAASVDVWLDVVDDNEFDGTQSVLLTVTNAAYLSRESSDRRFSMSSK